MCTSRNGLSSQIDADRILLRLDESLYSREAIINASYKFTDACAVRVDSGDSRNVDVQIRRRDGSVDNLGVIADNFCNEVLDQQVRLNLEKRYGRLREIIVEHAFSSPLTEGKNKGNR
jgi:His-Xaa-Ser system protein HxsD